MSYSLVGKSGRVAAVEWRSTEPAQVIRNLGTKRPAPRSAFPLIPREEHLEADFKQVWSSRIHHN